MQSYLLKLYVAEVTPSIERAIQIVREICEEQAPGCVDLQVIDVREQPQLAEEARILAIPTLVKELPPPVRRLIGDLSSRDKVLLGLDLQMQPRRGSDSSVESETETGGA